MTAAANIILTGFMGVGKSTVGAIVALMLKREFVDMDCLLEARASMTIAQIFAKQGEAAFRALERQLAFELAQRKTLVIATGGGTLIDAEVRAALGGSGKIFCLNADAAALHFRLTASGERPLAPNWQELYAARREVYARMPHQIETMGKTPEQLASEIIALDETALYVKTPVGGYPIVLGDGLLKQIPKDAERLGLTGHVIVVSNETVAPLYGEALVKSLPRADLITVPDGEKHKTLGTVRQLYDAMLAHGADRSSTLLALGGGVIGDMAGFAAATYMRGIRFVQAPTSLLAMVDASVGGKVGVDLPQGKNLIGAFKQPETVLLDTDTLKTLPETQWRCGMAEVIKHGLIAQPALLEPELWAPEQAARLLRQAIQVKIDVVAADPFEHGIRAHLNLGHTFGHAIEKVTQFAVPHGEAVAIGIVKAALLSRNLGMIDDALVSRIQRLLRHIGLPTDIQLDAERWYAAMATDKKWKAGVPRLVLLKGVGAATVIEGISKEEILAVL